MCEDDVGYVLLEFEGPPTGGDWYLVVGGSEREAHHVRIEEPDDHSMFCRALAGVWLSEPILYPAGATLRVNWHDEQDRMIRIATSRPLRTPPTDHGWVGYAPL